MSATKGKRQLETATRQWINHTFRAFHQLKVTRGSYTKQTGDGPVGPTECNVLTVRYLAGLKKVYSVILDLKFWKKKNYCPNRQGRTPSTLVTKVARLTERPTNLRM